MEPTFAGYSIGTWEDSDGDGRYDTLNVETRHIRGPRIFEASGIPLHKDNQTVVKERIALDKNNPNVLRQRDHDHRQRADPPMGRDAQDISANAIRNGWSSIAARPIRRSRSATNPIF